METIVQFWFTWFTLLSCVAIAVHAIKYETCKRAEWLVTAHMFIALFLLLIQVVITGLVLSNGFERLKDADDLSAVISAFNASMAFAVVNTCYFLYVKRAPIKRFIALFK
jgi:ABC-type sulfate transport system permease component